MKRLITLVAFFATVQASAQQVNPVPDYVFRNQMSVGRGTVTDTAAYFSIGPRYGATKGFMPPIVGDTATFSSGKRNGLLIFSVQKNKFLYWDSVRVQWSDMAGSSGSYITGSGITGYLPQFSASTTLDTSALFTLGNRLGIGTSTFAYNSTNTANIELNGTAGGILGFKRNDSARGYLWHTGDNMELANTVAGSISFNTNSATRGSISSAGVWRLHNLAGTGDRVVVASSNGTLSAASSATALVDTTTISTRAWRQKGLDSLAALEVSGSGTTNYVPKFTAGSTIGNSQIFDNGTNVGLGTASPGAKFHLLSATGTAQTQGDYANNVAIMQGASRTGTTSVGGSFATTLSLQSNDDVITAGSGASIGFAAKWNTGLYSSAAQFGSIFGGKENSTDANLAGYLSFATRPAGGNPTERLRITSGGDVGIGTSSPALKLHVVGDIGTTTRIATDLINGWTGGSTPLTIQTGGAQNLILGTNATERLRITSGGNIGIGTASPTGAGERYINLFGAGNSELHLTNNTSGTTSSDGLSLAYSGNDLYFFNFESGFMSFGTSNAERLRIFANGRIGVNTTTDAGYQLDINGTLRSVNGANFATTSGNVGIGTTSPANKLSINGAANALTYFLVDNSQTYLGDNGVIGGGAADGNTALSWFSTKDLYFKEGSSTRMTIKSGGELLINTTSDAGDYKLQVSGNVYNTGSVVLAATSGSVGINTSSPSAKLHVVSVGTAGNTLPVNASSIFEQSGNNVVAISGGSADEAGVFFPRSTVAYYGGVYRANDNLILRNNDAERARVNSAGELLINTTSDAGDYKLQVSGNALVTAGKLDIASNTVYGLGVARSGTSEVAGQIYNSNGILYLGAESSAGGQIFSGSSAYAAVIGSGANYPLQFAVNNVTRATINTNGELLINTTTDNGDFKLQVNGNALVSGSIKTANGGSSTAVPWHLGSVVATNVQLDTANYVEVEINGVFYRLAIVTPL